MNYLSIEEPPENLSILLDTKIETKNSETIMRSEDEIMDMIGEYLEYI